MCSTYFNVNIYDYILNSDPDLFYKYSVLQKDACYVSSHVPVQAQIKLPDCMVKNNDSTVIKLN